MSRFSAPISVCFLLSAILLVAAHGSRRLHGARPLCCSVSGFWWRWRRRRRARQKVPQAPVAPRRWLSAESVIPVSNMPAAKRCAASRALLRSPQAAVIQCRSSTGVAMRRNTARCVFPLLRVTCAGCTSTGRTLSGFNRSVRASSRVRDCVSLCESAGRSDNTCSRACAPSAPPPTPSAAARTGPPPPPPA